MKKVSVIMFAAVSFITAFLFFRGNSLPLPVSAVQGTEDDPFGAMRYRFNMIAGKNGFLDTQARLKAINFTIENLRPQKLMKDQGIAGWTNLGPGNIGGRIRGIVINKNTPTNILIGSASGGIWKTTNSGVSWSPKLDNGLQLAISCMVKDPSNENIVYAGTGEGWGNVDAVYGGGIYKSTDFGETWNLLASTIGTNIWNFRNVRSMAFDPSGNLYAVTFAYNIKDGAGNYYTNGGLYKSTDGGTSWSAINSTNFSTNYFNGCDVVPFSSATIIFATKLYSTTLGGIYRTTDGGTTWNKISTNLPTANFDRIAFTKDPNNSNTAYAVFESNLYTSPTYGCAGIFKTTDAGATWTALAAPGQINSTGYSYLSKQGWYDNVISVDPFNSNNIYVGGVDVMKSTNGGTSWAQLTYWTSFYGTPVVHADHHAITFDPVTQNLLYDGNDGGIYRSTNGGVSYTAVNNNLEITQFYSGAVSPDGSAILGGAQDNGHLKFSSGTSWTEVFGGDGGYSALDQSNPQISYEEYVYLAMSKTINGGSNWSGCTNGLSDADNTSLCLFIAPFSMNPENSNVLTAGSDKVWITSNSAATWTQSSNTLSASNLVTAVTAVNSASPYLGFAGTENGKVFKCTNLDPTAGIDSWTEITPPANNAAYVRRITVDPTDKQKIYVCYSGYNNTNNGKHIWYSTDQGTSWSDISTGLPDVPVHTLVVENANPSNLYIGTETGVYQTTNRGTTWTSANNNFPAFVPVDELVYQSGTNKLLAFTHGRGAFITTAPLPVELSSFTSSVKGNSVNLSWTTATENNSRSFDIERQNLSSGEMLFTAINKIQASGNSDKPLNYSFTDNKLVSGTYNYRLKMINIDGSFNYSSVLKVNITAPSAFSISQNYPNPFNPATSIKYSIPENTNVKLSVFNIKGELIKNLVEQFQTAGEYSVNFQGSNLASGLYFYKLDAGKHSQTMKMLLLK
jgi:photosystem II stability/assembly factor-like uncharacterized protein